MKATSTSLRKSHEVSIKDIFRRLEDLNESDRSALVEEYKEWIDSSEGDTDQTHVLYVNYITFEKY